MDTEGRFLRHMMIQMAYSEALDHYVDRYNARQAKMDRNLKFRLCAFRKTRLVLDFTAYYRKPAAAGPVCIDFRFIAL